MKRIGIVGLILGVIVCGSISYMVTANVASSSINYDKSKVVSLGGTKDKVQDAIDELYKRYYEVSSGNSRKRFADGEIVYYNPVTDQVCTNYTSSNSATGYVSNGCMRWFAYGDDGRSTTVKLLLDHNTTATQRWYSTSTNGNVALENSEVYPQLTALKTSSGWAQIPDLIDANDIVDIVGYKTINNTDTWDSSNASNYFYFETGQTSYKNFYNQSNYYSPYWWLYDRLNGCSSYGCQTNDSTSNMYGYWTKTTVGTAGSGSLVWIVDFYGYLSYDYANNSGRGVRPVVTVSKSKFSA